MALPKTFCWSRMGTEAGEQLTGILSRKEMERRACEGLFFWGVGNPVGAGLSALQASVTEPTVVFSEMRSKPALVDSAPSGLFLWLSYIDASGREIDLPSASLVTSRRVTVSGRPKDAHYAMVCSSETSICGEPIGDLDARRLVNVLSGRPVGSTQITAAVACVRKSGPLVSHYPVNFTATLYGPGQVRLARYAPIESADLVDAWRAAETCNVVAWRKAALRLKEYAQDKALYPISMQKRMLQAELNI